MSQHSDGLDETIEQTARVALTTAARVGEVLARVRQQVQERAASEGTEQARALAGRFEAERQAARATYGRVDDPMWWQSTTPEQVAEAYTLARAWRDGDPAAEAASRNIEVQIQQRHGLDLASLTSYERGPALVHAEQQLARGTDFNQARAARDLAAAEAADRGAAAQGADAENKTAGVAPEWDTHERRAETEKQLQEAGHPTKAVEARMLGDYAQARSADDIVRDSKAPHAQARAGRGKSPSQSKNRQQQRTMGR